MEPQLLDHALALLLLLAVPLWARWDYRKIRAGVAAGRGRARRDGYRRTVVTQWLVAGALAAWWHGQGRPWALLGLGMGEGARGIVALGLSLALVFVLVAQMVHVLRDPEHLVEVRRQLAGLRDLLPHDAAEGRWFRVVSVTAGVCEELLYRGFLFAYLEGQVGPVGALVLSSLVFGLGHLYQGSLGMLKTAGVGAVLGGLYLLGGSLLGPVLIHAVMDATSGELGRRAIEDEERTFHSI
jgi:membrane protease YdiL (CAAX protease family)